MLCSFSEDKGQCCKFFFFFNRKVKLLLTVFHVNHQVMRQIRYRFTLVTIWGVNCYRGYNILPADLISVEKPTNPIFPSPNVGNTTPIPIPSVCHRHNADSYRVVHKASSGPRAGLARMFVGLKNSHRRADHLALVVLVGLWLF